MIVYNFIITIKPRSFKFVVEGYFYFSYEIYGVKSGNFGHQVNSDSDFV